MKTWMLLAKRLLKKGFASADDKEKLMAKFAELPEEEQEEVATVAEQVDALPEKEPVSQEEEVEAAAEQVAEKLFAKVEKQLGEMVDPRIKAAISEHMELAKKRAGVYADDAKAKRKNLNEATRKFLSAVVNNDSAMLKEMSTTSNPLGGYTVDEELSAEIRHLTTEYGVARREMEVITLSKHAYQANNLATDVSVYWVDEGSAISSTQVQLGQEDLELKKLGAIVTMTNELLEDTEIDLVRFVASRVAEGFAQAEDEAFFKGDGTSAYGSFTGVLENSSVNEVTMTGTGFSSIDADDLINMVDATPQGAHSNGKFYMNRTIMSYIRKLKDNEGAYIYQMPREGGPATIWGYPVVLVEAMPSKTDSAAETSFVLFGDLRRGAMLGQKNGIAAKLFDAGVVRNVADNADINLITTDRVAVRWTERVGYVMIIPTAMTKLTTAAASA